MTMTQSTHNQQNIERMLQTIGARSADELFAPLGSQRMAEAKFDLPPAADQINLAREIRELAGRNRPAGGRISFLGAGSYDHYTPPAVDALAGQSAFVTAYTPYQAEASQGSLQAFFEYQSLVCDLTGMDVANSSLYEGGSALAEALLMAMDITGKDKVILPANVHPEYRQVVATYLQHRPNDLLALEAPDGRVNPTKLEEAINGETAAVVIQQPNFFGCVGPLSQIAETVRKHPKTLLIVVADPISLGLLTRPGQLGVDIVVGEGQSLGMPMGLGGPYLGFLACRQEYLRRIPGRLVGQTVDADGRRAFCLTLQTREQHIRRERAASNVCTNEGLLAIRAAVYLSIMGKQGIRQVADLCFQKAQYLHRRIAELDAFETPFGQPVFKEFVVRCRKAGVEKVLAAAKEHDILAGVPLGRWYPNLTDCLLVAVTEKRTRDEMNRFVEVLSTL